MSQTEPGEVRLDVVVGGDVEVGQTWRESPRRPSISSDKNQDVVAKIEEFQKMRKSKKHERFHRVFLLGLSTMIVGFALFGFLNLAGVLSSRNSTTAGLVFSSLSCVFLAIGVYGTLITSTVDPSEIDLDKKMDDKKEDWFFMLFLRWGVFIVLALNSLRYFRAFAIPSVIYCGLNFIIVLPTEPPTLESSVSVTNELAPASSSAVQLEEAAEPDCSSRCHSSGGISGTPASLLSLTFTSKVTASMLLDALTGACCTAYAVLGPDVENYNSAFGVKLNRPAVAPERTAALGAAAIYCFIEFLANLAFWIYARKKWLKNKEEVSSKSCKPTSICFITFLVFLNRFGVNQILANSVSVHLKLSPDGTDVINLVMGCLLITPPLLIFWQRENIFNYTARAFESAAENREDDGKFIAELLDSADLIKGMPWFVHAPDHDLKNREDASKEEKSRDRHKWWKGIVVEIRDEDFDVEIELPAKFDSGGAQMDKKIIKLQRKKETKGVDQEEMFKNAVLNLRCIDWSTLLEHKDDIFTTTSVRAVDEVSDASSIEVPGWRAGCKCSAKNCKLGKLKKSDAKSHQGQIWHKSCFLYSISRTVMAKERVAYFISHAWADSSDQTQADKKFSKLKGIAENFKDQNPQKECTFWLDKVCFDQNNLDDGLKVLPINIMCCDKVLSLSGEKYPTRLWCIWEIYALLAFSNDDAILKKRLKFCELDDSVKLHEVLKDFDVLNSYCYDPNEELKIRKVIEASGTLGKSGFHEFNEKIRRIAKTIGAVPPPPSFSLSSSPFGKSMKKLGGNGLSQKS